MVSCRVERHRNQQVRHQILIISRGLLVYASFERNEKAWLRDHPRSWREANNDGIL